MNPGPQEPYLLRQCVSTGHGSPVHSFAFVGEATGALVYLIALDVGEADSESEEGKAVSEVTDGAFEERRVESGVGSEVGDRVGCGFSKNESTIEAGEEVATMVGLLVGATDGGFGFCFVG